MSDGEQALAAARVRVPDLIVSDVMMPGMDGLGLVRALRADEPTRAVPVLLLSARAGEESTIEGLESGADEYLVKPFSANELVARVRALLAVSRLRQEALSSERSHAEEAERLLRESQKATRSREETLAVVSHDLRSPLTVIAAAAELLERKLVEPDARKQTDRIKRAARGLTASSAICWTWRASMPGRSRSRRRPTRRRTWSGRSSMSSSRRPPRRGSA